LIILQQEYFHTPKACLDFYFEIVTNMKNHEKKVVFMPRVQKIAPIQLF